jgi:hypothetical protein
MLESGETADAFGPGEYLTPGPKASPNPLEEPAAVDAAEGIG